MFVLREAFKVCDYTFGKPEQPHFSTEVTVKERLVQINRKNEVFVGWLVGWLENFHQWHSAFLYELPVDPGSTSDSLLKQLRFVGSSSPLFSTQKRPPACLKHRRRRDRSGRV